MPSQRCGSSSVLGLAFIVLATPTWAHHGIGRFDPTRELTVKGTLTGLDFVNPHSYVHFNAIDANGAVIAMQCEMRAATVLRRSGWSPVRFVPGVSIKIAGRPHRDDPHYCYADTLTIGDAPTLQRYQQLGAEASLSRVDRPLRLPSGKPNLAGDWAQEQYIMARPPQGPANLVPQSLVAAVEAGTVAMADVPSHGWFPPPMTLTAAGQAASDALRDLPPERNPRLSCQITSVLFDWVFDGTINRITQSDDVITMEYGRGLTRTVHMDLAAHPSRIAPSRAGHSIGRWENDVLIVDTVGFLPGVLTGSVKHSDQLHVVERFSLDPATMRLTRAYTAQDPVYLKGTYSGQDVVQVADYPFVADNCKELGFIDYSKEAGR